MLTLVISTKLIVRALFSSRHTGDPDSETFVELLFYIKVIESQDARVQSGPTPGDPGRGNRRARSSAATSSPGGPSS